MSGLNDWLDMSGDQQTALLQEDLEQRLAARRRRDAERAAAFPARRQPFSFPLLDSPAVHGGTSRPLPPATGESNSIPATAEQCA
jgi:hypothetical protein